jgi:oligopeptide/dipeptide ABC transporter ATP-binding protein
MSTLTLDRVSVTYRSATGPVSAVSDVSLTIEDGEVVGLVGESGCGKSTLALAIMGLLPAGAWVEGSVIFQGRDLASLSAEEHRRLRGDRVSMIFQDPLSALDPAFPVGRQVAETVRAHRDVSRAGARARALEMLTEVGIPDAARRMGDPPHRFSGGMRQRVVIAAALANEPALLIADEPTTALDTTIQAQILALLGRLRERHRMATLLISHNLGVVAQTCDRVGVLYAGQLVELAPVAELFARPRHPYTQTLVAAMPTPDHARGSLPRLGGRVPDLTDPPRGCRFAPRCPVALPECSEWPTFAGDGEHFVACWRDERSRAATEQRTGEPA